MTLDWWLCALPLAPLFTDAAAQWLATDARKAMDAAGWKVEATAVHLQVPINKLSMQLNGRLPLTYFWRLFVGLDDDFRREFLDLQAVRANALLLTVPDLQALVTDVRALVGRKRMAKADLVSEPARKVS